MEGQARSNHRAGLAKWKSQSVVPAPPKGSFAPSPSCRRRFNTSSWSSPGLSVSPPDRCLTLPSSGQSTGCARRLPLKSNVRRRNRIARRAPVCISWPSIPPPMSRRALRPATARARAVRTEAESSQRQDVQCSLGTCHLRLSGSTLSSMALAPLFQFGVESGLRCGRYGTPSESILCGSASFVHRSSVHLARKPSKCPPRKCAPSNPSFKRTCLRPAA